MQMGEMESCVRRSGRIMKNQMCKAPAKVRMYDSDDDLEEEWEQNPKTKHKGKHNSQLQMADSLGISVVDIVSHELGSLKLINDSKKISGIVLNAAPQEFDRSMERSSGLPGEEAAGTSSSDDGDEGDNSTDYESAGEQEEISTTLSREDSALFTELMQVIEKGGDLKKLRVDHLKAYLRHHGLRMSGLKAVLLTRVQEHLRIKDGQGQDIYPRSSFTINCKGDVCLGDTVLFSQNVYDSFNIVKRSAGGPPLGQRWVAGKVVNESYGAEKQQHTFTIEVLWSTGTQPFYVMRPLQIKGRNLYRMHTSRQPWINEAEREKVLAEKHARGEEARAKRRAATGARGSSRTRPGGSKGHTKTRHHGESSRSTIPPPIPPPMPPSQFNSIQLEGIHTERNIYEGNTAPSSNQLPSWIPAPHISSIFPGRTHTQQNVHHGNIGSSSQGRAGAYQQQQRVYRGSNNNDTHYYGRSNNVYHGRDERGIVHIACSNRGCEKAGAKNCITQSCASCCYFKGSRRSCPRHQNVTTFIPHER